MNFAQLPTASALPWQLRHADGRAALAMAQQHGVSELLAGILVGRNVAVEDVPQFLTPTLRDYLPDPFHLLDMDKAVARILTAVARGETIAVFGDYDVDGATSTALLMQYLGQLGARVVPYIPDRMLEGYGPTVAAFAWLMGESRESSVVSENPSLTTDDSRLSASPKATLILTVDCGTLAHEPIAYAKARGVDVIVLDHHLSSGALPPAYAVVNPNRVDETSPHTNLAAVGVVFLLLVGLNKKLRETKFFEGLGARDWGLGSSEKKDAAHSTVPSPTMGEGVSAATQSPIPNPPSLLSYLDIVALGTVCDVMPLTGLNRAFVAQGLKVMAQRRNLGLAVLSDVARMDEAPNVYHLGFLLGPRINAGGRVGKSGLGVALLTATDEDEARAIAATLDVHNQERQAIEAEVLEQALALAASQANLPVILVASVGWHQGVIGIVAGRLKEKFGRPAMVVAIEDGMGKASGRSVTGVDMGAAIHAAVAEGLIEKGGGHAMAAGFSVEAAQIAALHQFLIARMERDVAAYTEARVQKYDGLLSVSGATLETLEDVSRAGPFGMGNPAPRFVVPNARIAHVAVMKEKHLRVTLADESGSSRLNAVAFGAVGTPLGAWLMAEKKLHLLGELKRNSWQGRDSAQFIISDAARVG